MVKKVPADSETLKGTETGILLSSVDRKPPAFHEVYPILEPYVYAAIVKDTRNQKLAYEVIEPTLQPSEKAILVQVKRFLMDEVDVSFNEIETKEKAMEYLKEKAVLTIGRYRLRVGAEAFEKLFYYIARDFIGYGKIDPLMRDQLIEDISTDGIGIPVYIWHRMHESLPTNVVFDNEGELNSFIVRLAYMAGKNVSIASPLLDASLPDGSRIQMSYGSEVTKRGPTFTIRRFRADPLTISDLIALNTISSEMAAYLWYIIENRASVIVAGGVAAGKTTMLNCLSMFIKPEMKIVSVEDTQELNLPHENWIPSVVRLGFARGNGRDGSISLFDLLKTAVRQRPDYIIVGEVRGEEAFTLFQAMATGHLGMSTIHAESVEAVMNRLESEPMNIPRALVATIDVVIITARMDINDRPSRRATTITEVLDANRKTNEISTNAIFTWNPKKDNFTFHDDSSLLEKQKEKLGISTEDVKHELLSRRTVLEWMAQKGIRHYTEVSDVIREYYLNPTRVYQKARVGAK